MYRQQGGMICVLNDATGSEIRRVENCRSTHDFVDGLALNGVGEAIERKAGD
jgi:hypothetical protein